MDVSAAAALAVKHGRPSVAVGFEPRPGRLFEGVQNLADLVGPDPSFPYPDGSIGVWGYDFSDGGGLVRPSSPDLISYCSESHWISDYSFTNALRYRLFEEGAPAGAAATVATTRSLLIWGGVGADSVPYWNPSSLSTRQRRFRTPLANTGSAGGLTRWPSSSRSASQCRRRPTATAVRPSHSWSPLARDAAAGGGAAGLEMLFSRGIPAAAAWRR